MFRKLSKIFSLNLCIAEIILLMRISSWNFILEPKATLWAHVQNFSLKFLPQMWFLVLYIFTRIFLENSWNVSETNPWCISSHAGYSMESANPMTFIILWFIQQAGMKMWNYPKFNSLICVKSKCYLIKSNGLLWLLSRTFPQKNVLTGLILGLHPANERHHYKVTLSLIGWAQTWNQHCIDVCLLGS